MTSKKKEVVVESVDKIQSCCVSISVCVKEKWKKRMIIKRWTKRSCPYIQELTRIIIGVTYEEQHIWDAPHSAAFLLQERDPLVPLYRDWADSSTHTYFSSFDKFTCGGKGEDYHFLSISLSNTLIFWICIISKKICSPLPLFPFPKSGYVRGGLGSFELRGGIYIFPVNWSERREQKWMSDGFNIMMKEIKNEQGQHMNHDLDRMYLGTILAAWYFDANPCF